MRFISLSTTFAEVTQSFFGWVPTNADAQTELHNDVLDEVVNTFDNIQDDNSDLVASASLPCVSGVFV